MSNPARKISSEDVRKFVEEQYIQSSRKKGVKRFTVNAGDVHRSMGLQNRVPLVCSALQSQKFLAQHGLTLVERTGPASGLSTSVNLTFEFSEERGFSKEANPLLRLRGIARESFAKLGGGEKFISAERRAFSKEDDAGTGR